MTSNFDGCLILPGGPLETRGRRRKHNKNRASTGAERKAVIRAEQAAEKIKRIAVLDFETDPFDPKTQAPVYPFTACIYAEDFEPIVIWEENLDVFISRLLSELEGLSDAYTIYAHNGGKFDFMFLIHKLRGRVSFKGRGLMAAKIGIHELRDSTHILPMKLSDWKKDDFDYEKMRKDKRNKYRDEIIRYMVNDCKSLFEIVKAFVAEFGFKLTIGQAAMSELKKGYQVARLAGNTDNALRSFFFGGRVECLAGAGHFVGRYKLYDVNSMYPNAMANFAHPIGGHYTWRRRGGVTPKTIFLEITCDNWRPGSIGALVKRRQVDGAWETTAQVQRARFYTTIWEFRAANELGLISNIEFHQFVDCDTFSDFSGFIVPMYERRFETKRKMRELRDAGFSEESPEFLAVKKEDIFLKFLLNNSYGKFAINPRRFKDHFITDHGAPAPPGFEDQARPTMRNATLGYDIWEKPAWHMRFNNVGTAASITGAARSVLMRALVNATDPIYCDTDSIICRQLDGVEIDKTKLGAWDLEAEFDEVVIAGKKLYACKTYSKDYGQADKVKVRSKGAPEGELNWGKMLQLLDDQIVPVAFKAPLILKSQEQRYPSRNIRRTAPFVEWRPRETFGSGDPERELA